MAAKFFYGDEEDWPAGSDDDFIDGGDNHHGVNAAAADAGHAAAADAVPKKQRFEWIREEGKLGSGKFSFEEAKDWRFASSSIESIDPYNVA